MTHVIAWKLCSIALKFPTPQSTRKHFSIERGKTNVEVVTKENRKYSHHEATERRTLKIPLVKDVRLRVDENPQNNDI